MAPVILRPHRSYRTKLLLITLVVAIPTLLGSIAIGLLAGADVGGARGASIGVALAIVLNLLWIGPSLLAIPRYCRSLQYEILDNEVIVRAGILTKSVKHVPYRTVTNLKVARGPFDRLLRLGSLEVQTAGMSGQSGAEERLAGLEDCDEAYGLVATRLRRFRSPMAPTQAGDEPAPEANVDAILRELRSELRSIRASVDQLVAG